VCGWDVAAHRMEKRRTAPYSKFGLHAAFSPLLSRLQAASWLIAPVKPLGNAFTHHLRGAGRVVGEGYRGCSLRSTPG
jgi:hypothetical protein